MSNHTLVRDGNVKVRHIINGKRQSQAEIIVNDQFTHRFPTTSRVSKHLEMMSANDLGERLTGGSFMFIDDKLIDFRDGHYNGFVHTDDTISKFMEVLGYQNRDNMPMHRRRRNSLISSDSNMDDTTSIVLSKVWSNNEIEVPGYTNHGGDFNSRLSFSWNPFVKTVNSEFDLIRLICTNGMIGMSNLLSNKVPLFNRWEEHLNIAAAQIQTKVANIVTGRTSLMSTSRASVGDCLLLAQHASDRLQHGTDKEEGERDRLMQLIALVSPIANLTNWYNTNVFSDRNLCAQLPSHLSSLDMFNIVTELRSHTNEVQKSSNFALDRLANGLLFDSQGVNRAAVSNLTSPRLSPFSDADRAYWGVAD